MKKKQLVLSLSIALAMSAVPLSLESFAKMSTESYRLFQETTILEKESNYVAAIEKIKKAISENKKCIQ